jgi:alanine-alpha-ketoisovalerate/valine-pyruvate aminotransferase
MFLWLRLHGVPCADAILERLQAEKVVVVPGADPDPTLPYPTICGP